MTTRPNRAARPGSYHHGDLRRALIEAGTALARAGGPDAVVLREVTRQVGVTANAAYRHFADRDALVAAVCSDAQTAVALTMEAELAEVEPSGDDGADACAHLRAVGAGYLLSLIHISEPTRRTPISY